MNFYKPFFLTLILITSNNGVFAQPSKMVLIEEATGTWCAWCPKGKVFSEMLLETYNDKLIFIEVHRNDPMENEEYSDES